MRCAACVPHRRCRSCSSTNRPEIKSIKDFKEGHKIAVPGVKNSNQAICLQMAAAKEWGQQNYAQLDPFTITLPHPDAAIAIISRSTGTRRALRRLAVSGLRGGSARHACGAEILRHARRARRPTASCSWRRNSGDANPKVTSAVYAAFERGPPNSSTRSRGRVASSTSA